MVNGGQGSTTIATTNTLSLFPITSPVTLPGAFIIIVMTLLIVGTTKVAL